MATTITAGNATNNGAAIGSDSAGTLEIKTGSGAGTTAISIDASQAVTIAGNLIINGTIGAGQQVAFPAGSAAAPSITFTGDANTGIYSPGADAIGFAEGGAQVGEFDASANFKFNSGYGSVATAYGCRAWVNFNGTGTVAIRASGNVTSISDNGTGDYTVNFTNAMPDAQYSVVTANGSDTPGSAALRTAGPAQGTTYTTTAVRVISGYMGAGAPNRQAEDCGFYNVAVFR
jgi:hypothetical protein